MLSIHGDTGEGNLGIEQDHLEERARLLEKAVLRGIRLGALVLLDSLGEAVLGHGCGDDPVHGNAMGVLWLRELRVG